jgi:cytochrome c556
MSSQRYGLAALMVTLIALLGTAPLSFGESSDEQPTMKEVEKEMQDLTEAIKGYTVAQRDKAMEKTNAALDAIDKRIDALENHIDSNWEKMSKQARQNARATMKTLREQRLKVAEQYGSLKSSSAKAWEHVKKGFLEAYATLQRNWKKSEKELDSKE